MRWLPVIVLLLFLFETVPVRAGCPGTCGVSPFPTRNTPKTTKNRPNDVGPELIPFSVMSAARKASYMERKRSAGKHYDVLPPVVLRPERIQWVRISATDVNRIVCSSGKITDVFYSAEKGVKVETAGHEAYLKLQVKILPDGKVEYSSIPTEVYIVCGGNTYGFIGRPYASPPVRSTW